MLKFWMPFLLVTTPILAQSATLEAPAQAPVGSSIEVSWAGPGNNYDTIYVTQPEAADRVSGTSKVASLNGKNPLALTVPDHPGLYELRYWDTQAKATAARRPIEVVDVATTLEAADTADLGSTIEVSWTGPGNNYDRIGIYPAGAADDARALAGEAILNKANPIAFKLPEHPGDYELRYIMSRSKRIKARRPLAVLSVEVSLKAPETADFGSVVEVSWQGPGNDYDLINLYPAGADDDARAVGGTAILSQKNPIRVRLPEDAGDYELRYVTSKSKRVLGRRPIRVGGAAASLEAADRATAMTLLEIGWQGPGNDYDQIALYAAGAADDAKPLATVGILKKKNPVRLKLPDGEGRFELRYVTTRGKTVLARRALAIEPAGRLAVVFERDGKVISQSGGVGAIELILDASGSMLKQENGVRRIETARRVLTELVTQDLGEDRELALRVFGHKQADACRTDLEVPLGPLDRGAAAGRIASINAKNLAKTPIAASLAKVPSDLAGAEGPKTVILITDGEETCGGDPAAEIERLRSQGLDLQVSIVGFAIDDAQLKSDFETWAELGGGSYFDASSAEELTQSLRTVISGPFQVLDASGKVAATGVVGGAEVILPADTYRIQTVGSPPRVLDRVEIRPGELTRAAF